MIICKEKAPYSLDWCFWSFLDAFTIKMKLLFPRQYIFSASAALSLSPSWTRSHPRSVTWPSDRQGDAKRSKRWESCPQIRLSTIRRANQKITSHLKLGNKYWHLWGWSLSQPNWSKQMVTHLSRDVLQGFCLLEGRFSSPQTLSAFWGEMLGLCKFKLMEAKRVCSKPSKNWLFPCKGVLDAE